MQDYFCSAVRSISSLLVPSLCDFLFVFGNLLLLQLCVLEMTDIIISSHLFIAICGIQSQIVHWVLS